MAGQGWRLGNRIAPPRFVVFSLLILVGMPVGITLFGCARGAMAAFDVAAIVFLISSIPLLDDEAGAMRRSACDNDANRAGLLAITGVVTVVVLAAVASELMHGKPDMVEIALVIGTLVIAWVFSNMIYALHYAHMFYTDAGGKDSGGVSFPETPEPDYWDFIYFATCLGMTFQVSDMTISSGRMRRVVTFHCLAAFVYNLGVIAFTINVLGGSG